MLYNPNIVPEPDPVDGLISRACMARYLLGILTEDFSQTYYFVSWLDDLPIRLWAAAHGEEVEGAFGTAALSQDERQLILELAAVSGGWWAGRPNYSEPGDSFIGLEEWRGKVAESKCA